MLSYPFIQHDAPLEDGRDSILNQPQTVKLPFVLPTTPSFAEVLVVRDPRLMQPQLLESGSNGSLSHTKMDW